MGIISGSHIGRLFQITDDILDYLKNILMSLVKPVLENVRTRYLYRSFNFCTSKEK